MMNNDRKVSLKDEKDKNGSNSSIVEEPISDRSDNESDSSLSDLKVAPKSVDLSSTGKSDNGNNRLNPSEGSDTMQSAISLRQHRTTVKRNSRPDKHHCGGGTCNDGESDNNTGNLVGSVHEKKQQKRQQQQQQWEESPNPMLRSRMNLVKRTNRKQANTGSEHYFSNKLNDDQQPIVTLGNFAHGDGNQNCVHEYASTSETQCFNKLTVDNNNNSCKEEELFNSHEEDCSRRSSKSDKYKEVRSKTNYRCSESRPPQPPGITNLLENLFDITLFSNRKVSNSSELIEWQDQAQSLTRVEESERIEEEEASGNMANPGGYGATSGTSNSNESNRRRHSSVTRRPRDPYGYSKLNHGHYQKSKQESSLFQEFKRFLLLLIIVSICGVILWQIHQILIDEETNYLGVVKHSPSKLGKFYNYAVSTDAKPCARVGKLLLAKGGHAVDAAVGTLICMGVVLPNSLGLGGGCLMTIYDNVTKQATVIDGREEAPNYAHETMFDASNPLSASRGPLSVGVPGELAAYWEAHRRFGRLKWAELFAESIGMAQFGEPTVEHLCYALREMQHAKYISPPLREIYWNNSTNEYVREGDILKQPALAETLKRIRDNGVNEFYGGKTGQMFIEDLKRQGGQMTLENLSNYKVLVKNATLIELNNMLRVYTQPVPGSGIVLSIILRIMRELGYYKNEKPKGSFEAAGLYYHHLAEAYKFAYAQRGALEDEPDDPKRMEKLIAKLESDDFIREAVSKIRDDKTLPMQQYGGLQYFQEDHGTAHVSVVDSEGNSVAVTSSVNLYFGSGLVSPTTGIVYNDVMDDFVSPHITNKFHLLPSKFNRIRPGRRPLSSMAPSIFVNEHGSPLLVMGASGGSMITTAIASVSLRNLFMNEDIKTAIDGPRIHHQFLPEKIWFEQNFPPELLGTLVHRGHGLQKITGRSSVVMAIACEYTNNGTQKQLTANSDHRKGGTVDGL